MNRHIHIVLISFIYDTPSSKHVLTPKVEPKIFIKVFFLFDRLCDPVVGVPGYRSLGSDSIPGATRLSEN
jgi:hypothetical protein